MEVALASVSDFADALPAITSRVMDFELDSATSMVRAALDSPEMAALDVSGLARDMGDLLATVRTESVGRLVHMAAFSPITWVLLGVVVVASAEIARRELRNAANDPPGEGGPDLQTSWGLL